MNWRNPFLTAYLAVTVIGAGILGYFVYSSYSHFAEVSDAYDSSVAQLQKLQNRTPFPSAENNQAYAALTRQYQTEYEKLIAQVLRMQKPLETITPQAFQDRLRAYVSEVSAAAKQNGVTLKEDFYLGFDKYRDNLPSNEASSVLARQLNAIRMIVDDLVTFKVREIVGIKRELLPEEGGAAQPTHQNPPNGRPMPNAAPPPSLLSTNSFELVFVSDQTRLRQALNSIATADQFFIIRYLNIVNSSLEGPKRQDDATTAAATPPPDPSVAPGFAPPPLAAPSGASSAPSTSMRLLVGRETLTAALRIEMITFNPPAPK